MSISLNANFELLSAGLYLDARQQFNTIIEMKDFAETSIPDGFITYNKETQKRYAFSSFNTVDATLGKWREYDNGNSSSTTYATWNSNVDYKVGNVVLKDEVRYSCIADHTSTDFETDSINWVVVLEQYYHVTQEQYNKMVSDGLITDSTKDLYIIDGNSEGGNSSANYTSLEALGLTAPITVGEIFNAMADDTMAMIGCEDITAHITDVPMSYGILTIKKKNNSRFSIEYQNSLGGSATNVKRWIGTLKGTDGTGLYWKELQTEIGVVITTDTITKYGTEILKYPIGTWRIDSVAIGGQFTDLPYSQMAGIIEIDSIQPNRSPYEHGYGYRNYTFRDALTNSVYTRSLNSGNTVGTIQRDSGWCTTGSHFYKLSQMYLTTNATIQDVIDALPIGGTALLRTDEFANWSTLFNGIQWGYLKVEKTVNGLSNIELQEVVGANRRYFGTQSGGKFSKWMPSTDQFHRIISQNKAGYFKFKPCSNPTLQGIRITVTDNYGGMIDISGVTPNQTQYKPFKCVRLSHSTYTDYNASNPANNKMEKLFYFDGYMYLKIVTYTTVTFTNLIEEPTFVETIDEGAEEIPIVSAIATQYDGYGDPYIISIGEVASSDGTIQTLENLGFSNDILTWDTGIYKVSHVRGLINIPSDITNATPGFRLEHHNIKKWMDGHNPSRDTWGQRHSVLYVDNGNVYHRFYESGTTAGTYIKDTGWKQIITENSWTDPYTCTKYTVLTGTEDLFTLPCGHYVSDKINTAYNYPITDSSNVTAHIYVLGCLNDPTNNKGYRIIFYFDNKNRMYRINEWWGNFSNGWVKIPSETRVATLETQVNELFQSVSDGKTLVANAITGKGVSTSTSATFATMATNISKIPQSVTWQEETVTATRDADTRIATFVFSNTVLGVRQMTAPAYHATAEATELKMFTISGNTVKVKVESGTWRMTAMVRVSQ